MKRPILIFSLRTLIVAAFFFLCVRLIATFDNADRHITENHNILRVQNMSSYDSLDLLFIGNSYVYSSIIPEAFEECNIHSYNLGIASAGPGFYELLIKDYFKISQSLPDTICLLISPMTFSSLSDNFDSYPIHRYLNEPISDERLVIEIGSISDYPELLSRSASKGFQHLVNHSSKKLITSEMTERGFYRNDEVFSERVYESTKHHYTALLEDRFDYSKAEKFSELLEFIRQKGVGILIIELPTHRLKDFLNPGFEDEYRAFRDEVSEEYPLISFPEILPDSCYRNIDHLNYRGALEVTRFLKDSICSE